MEICFILDTVNYFKYSMQLKISDANSDIMDADQDLEQQARVEAERAVTRSGYRKLMDEIADNEEVIVDVNGDTNHLLQFLQNNEELYKEVDAPQEAVMDAVVVKHLSRLCKKQAENMSTK